MFGARLHPLSDDGGGGMLSGVEAEQTSLNIVVRVGQLKAAPRSGMHPTGPCGLDSIDVAAAGGTHSW